jgi:formate/nitrite transporter
MAVVVLLGVGFYGSGSAAATTGLASGSVGAKAILVANAKLQLSWQAAFARAVLCNWLVCVAVWVAAASKTVTGKIIACSLPVMAFVASGFEHSIANMFFVPMGMIAAKVPAVMELAAKTLVTPDGALTLEAAKAGLGSTLTWANFVVSNLIPVTLGNIAGGAGLVAAAYWFAYLEKAPELRPVKEGEPVLVFPNLQALYTTSSWGDMSDL